MKKLFMTVAAATMIFASCKKDEASKPLDLETLPKITLKGTVYANLNEIVPELQFAPAGTVVRISVPYRAYDANNNSGGYYVKTTQIDAKGEYSIEVPYVSTGVDATLSFEDFTANVTVVDPSTGASRTVLKHFTRGDIAVNGLGKGQGEGDYRKIDATYAENAKDPNADVIVPTTTVDLSGKLEYLRIDSSGASGPNQWAGVPSGKKIVVKIVLEDVDVASTRKYEITQSITSGAGSYAVKVPMIERGKATVTLIGEMFEEMRIATTDTKREMWRHELNQVFTVYNSGKMDGQDARYVANTSVYDID